MTMVIILLSIICGLLVYIAVTLREVKQGLDVTRRMLVNQRPSEP